VPLPQASKRFRHRQSISLPSDDRADGDAPGGCGAKIVNCCLYSRCGRCADRRVLAPKELLRLDRPWEDLAIDHDPFIVELFPQPCAVERAAEQGNEFCVFPRRT
jgi:hypothetical protein